MRRAGLLWRAGLPALECEALPVKPPRVLLTDLVASFGAASQPNAGQARSPQQACSSQTTSLLATHNTPNRHTLLNRHRLNDQLTAQPPGQVLTGLGHARLFTQARHQKLAQPGKAAIGLQVQHGLKFQRTDLA